MLEQEGFRSHVIRQWIGHSEATAQNHYLQVLPTDFERALARGHMVGSNGAQQESRTHKIEVSETTKPAMQADAASGSTSQSRRAPPVGLERCEKQTGKTAFPEKGGANGGAVGRHFAIPAHDYPLHVVTNWLGNTPRIALRHYLQVTDADFAQAARRGAECGAQVAQNAAQQAHAARRTHSQETTKAPAVTRAYATRCDDGREDARPSSGEDRIRTCGPVARSRI